ncbi:MAG: carboxypeptidase-like regulatory domain-containing protein [Pyrinomonadaceae bacterium]
MLLHRTAPRNIRARVLSGVVLLLTLLGGASIRAQDRATGGLKGKVHVAGGASASGIEVTARQGTREVAHAATNGKGDFELRGLAPGIYGLTFRKPGLSIGRLEEIEVRAGKTRTVDRLYLPVDEGSIAFLRGSVFDPNGHSVGGARVELSLVRPDGTLKKLESRVTTETGAFAFRMTPEPARYRLSFTAHGLEPTTKDVDVDSAAIFRVAVTLNPAAK